MVVTACIIWLKCLFSGSFILLESNHWLQITGLEINWGLFFDTLSCSMLFLVSIISFLVHLYSVEYMFVDHSLFRFISLLSLFTLTMFIFIISDNLLQMFFGWEGIGICSYLLINFWHTRREANSSAIKAVIINRIGDGALLISLALSYFLFNSLNYFTIFTILPYYLSTFSFNAFDFIFFFQNEFYLKIYGFIFFLILGSLCKSAQFIFHTWLPDAMEGPTPVSALIHAATMVTAGIFLIIRFSPIIELFIFFKFVLGFFGAFTAFFAGTCGLFQFDIKKIIAYSTCSQLGYMLFACSISAYNLAFFHLLSHAFFKALLFLGAGSVIHAIGGEQDIRKMGSLGNFIPITYLGLFCGSLSLIGFPFLSGFFSKDLILETALCNTTISSFYFIIFIYLALFCTLLYSFRLLFYVFFSSLFREHYIILLQLKESSFLVNGVLIILSLFSIFWGFIFFDFFSFTGVSLPILISPSFFIQFEGDLLPFFLKILPLIFCLFFFFLFISVQFIISIFFDYLLFSFNFKRSQIFSLLSFFIFFFSIKKWNFDELYNFFAVNFLHFSQNIFFRIIDRGLLEYIFILNILNQFSILSKNIERIQSGIILDYLFSFLFFLSFFFFSSFIFL
jgi:proton-translocating NADH-quinone oxidoreductase chain L